MHQKCLPIRKRTELIDNNDSRSVNIMNLAAITLIDK